MFVTVDGEDLARKVFRRAQNVIRVKSEARERKIQGMSKNSNNNIFKREFPQQNHIFFHSR